MNDKDKTKEQLLEEIVNLRRQIYDLEIFKLTREHITQTLIDNESKLIESEKRYRMIFDNINDGIIIHDAEGHIFDVNKNMYTRLGYTKDEMIDMSLSDLVVPEFSSRISTRVKKLEKEGVAIFESGDRRKDGSVLPVEVSARIISYKGHRAILSVVRDITQRKIAEDFIKSALDEKEILLEELQNQIRRTCQSVSVMILQQARTSSDPVTSAVLQKTKDRLDTYTKIYEKFYRYKNYARIDIAGLVQWLTKRIVDKRPGSITNITIKRDIKDVSLSIHQAIPCSLIIQELVTNGLDHAFPGNREGEIHVKMTQNKKGSCRLQIKDNGIGFPPGKSFSNIQTAGLRLVKDFVKQLDGSLRFSLSRGVFVTISFTCH